MSSYTGPGLADPAERARLTPAARRGGERLRRAWSLTDAQFRGLMGSDPAVDADVGPAPMSEDELRRVGLLVGIYAALHALHRAELADAWITRPNTNPLFGGRTPLEAMTLGGLTMINAVHDLLTARAIGS